jgi:surface antigen
MKLYARAFAGLVTAVLLISAAPAGAAQYWQCVPVARILSGIQLFGDAWTWWNQAPGKYETGHEPQVGSVLVFKPTGRMNKGHVAVVARVISDRFIEVDHANWSQIDGRRGKVEQNVIVVDASPAGDWSQVKVWYDPARDVGTTVYPVYGFIYQDEGALRLAGAVEGVQLASTLASSFPGMSQTTDAIGALIQSLTAPRAQ